MTVAVASLFHVNMNVISIGNERNRKHLKITVLWNPQKLCMQHLQQTSKQHEPGTAGQTCRISHQRSRRKEKTKDTF